MKAYPLAACALALFAASAIALPAHAAATSTPSEPLAEYRAYFDGRLVIRTPQITEAAALANCTKNHERNRSANARCTWGSTEIYREAGKAAYRIYINGRDHGGTASITRAGARENCVANHKLNKDASVRCTWNGDTIYDEGPLVAVDSLYEYWNGKLFWTVKGIGKANALARCTADHERNPSVSMRCLWGETQIYSKGPLSS